MGAGVGEAHGIDETAGGVLAEHGFPVTGAGFEADTLGGNDTDLGNTAQDVVDNRGGGSDDARGNGERP